MGMVPGRGPSPSAWGPPALKAFLQPKHSERKRQEHAQSCSRWGSPPCPRPLPSQPHHPTAPACSPIPPSIPAGLVGTMCSSQLGPAFICLLISSSSGLAAVSHSPELSRLHGCNLLCLGRKHNTKENSNNQNPSGQEARSSTSLRYQP